MKISYPILFAILITIAGGSYAQQNSQSGNNVSKSRNLAEIRESFYNSLGLSEKDLEEYRRESSKRYEESENHTDGLLAQFHRWEWLMRTRVDANGNLPDPGMAAREFVKYRNSHPQFYSGGVRDISWEAVGSADVPTDGGGAGRTNVLEFDPTNPDIMYVGAAGGGVWKSEDAGQSWICLTDAFPVTGIADIAINPDNPLEIYAATGDGYGYEITWQSDEDFWGGVYTSGIMKTTDGGITWSPTGLSYEQNQLEIVQRVVLNPGDPAIVLAATRGGIYRSTDAGATFSLVSTVHCYDFAFKPDDVNTVYSGGDKDILVSTDAGATWAVLADGILDNGRISIETTPANPNLIYAFSEGGKFKRSVDNGLTWENMTKPSTKTSFYGYYDTDFGVSDIDENALIAGGLEIVVSSNGADSWTNVSTWDGYNDADYVHADGKCSKFYPGSNTTVFSTNDGGIFISTDFGESWTDLSDGLRIAQIYRLGTSLTNPDKVISGWQDNGSNLWDGSTYRRVYGADGMEAAIDPLNENILYEETQYGGLNKSTDNGVTWNGISPGGGDWVTPYIIDPVDNDILYYGSSSSIYKSTNAGSSWSNVGGSFNGTLFALAVAPSNNQYVYGASLTQVKVSKNGGSSWTDITAGLPTSGNGFNYIAVDNNDPEHVYVALSAYSDGNKVYESSDAGTTWTNISGTLPNVPVNTIVYQPDSQDGIYVGTDLGVFYRDNTLSDWIPFMEGLPNVMVHELEINTTNNKLYAATYGRGIWRSDLYGYVQYTNDIGVTSVIMPSGAVCVDQLNPAVKVKNFGSNTVTSFDLNYSVDGGAYEVYSWNGTMDPLQILTITLPETGMSIGEHSFQVYTSSPNGIADNNQVNDADTSGFNVLAVGSAIPLTEGYESGLLPATWTYNNDDELWQITDQAGGFGQSVYSAKANFFEVGSGKSDAMVTPYLDLTGALTPITLSFDFAHANKSDTKGDTLAVGISTDCGATYTNVFYKGGAELETAPQLSGVEFVPTADQWITEVIDLSAYQQFNRVLIRFEAISRKGNSLYLDNINLAGIPSAEVSGVTSGRFDVFPNPTSGVVNYRLPSVTDEGRIEVLDVLGQAVLYLNTSRLSAEGTLDLGLLPPGVYQLKLYDGGELKSSATVTVQ
jgi:photosystem II stability/assembly factor-like uncharacterized protein